jgi:hypothetical protein
MAEVANTTDGKAPEGSNAETTNASPNKFDEKLKESDKIMEEAKHDGDNKASVDDLYDEHGNFDDFGAKIRGSYSFKHKEESLTCDALRGNSIYERLRNRIIKFHVEQEKYRKFGPTQKHID